MNNPNDEIHLVQQSETGSFIPVITKKKGAINIKDKKGFTVKALTFRWNKKREEVIEMLHKYQVPGHINYRAVKNMPEGKLPVDYAFFFEEYIHQIEHKYEIRHSKLKARPYRG